VIIGFAGVILRDSHGVAQVRFVTGNKILRILKAKGLAPVIPEDLYYLIKKAVAIRKHLERNRKVCTASNSYLPEFEIVLQFTQKIAVYVIAKKSSCF